MSLGASSAATSVQHSVRHLMEQVTTLHVEVAALRQDLVELRQELPVQSQVSDRLREARLKEVEEILRNEIQSVCEGLEIKLKNSLSSAMAIERDALEQQVSNTHAAMVAHGTYVVARLDDFASMADGCQGKPRGSVKALRRALKAGKEQAPAGSVVLDRIAEECASHLEDDASKCTQFQAEQAPHGYDAACNQRLSCETASGIDRLVPQDPPSCLEKQDTISWEMVGTECGATGGT